MHAYIYIYQHLIVMIKCINIHPAYILKFSRKINLILPPHIPSTVRTPPAIAPIPAVGAGRGLPADNQPPDSPPTTARRFPAARTLAAGTKKIVLPGISPHSTTSR